MTRRRNPRDERGWRVPSRHTIAEHVYRLMQYGCGPTQIARATGCNRNTVAVMMFHIRHPEIHNAYRKKKVYGEAR